MGRNSLSLLHGDTFVTREAALTDVGVVSTHAQYGHLFARGGADLLHLLGVVLLPGQVDDLHRVLLACPLLDTFPYRAAHPSERWTEMIKTLGMMTDILSFARDIFVLYRVFSFLHGM